MNKTVLGVVILAALTTGARGGRDPVLQVSAPGRGHEPGRDPGAGGRARPGDGGGQLQALSRDLVLHSHRDHRWLDYHYPVRREW